MDQALPAGMDDVASRAVFALMTAQRVVSDALEREVRVACGLSPAEADVLMTLARGADGRQRMVDIAGQLCVSKSGATQIVDRLVQSGLVQRETSPRDRRLVYAVMTAAGREVLAKAMPVLPAVARDYIGDRLRDVDIDRLTTMLELVAEPVDARQAHGLDTSRR